MYSCSIKIHASGFEELLECVFLPSAGCGSVFPAKVVEMLEEAIVVGKKSGEYGR